MAEVKFEVNMEALVKAVNDVAVSDLWRSVSRENTETSWALWVNFNERQTTAALAWLLDPEQGHGAGDFFLKRLIMEAVKNGAFMQHLGEYDPLQLMVRSFNTAYLDTEVAINDEEGPRYVDLMVIDPYTELAIIIERKTGSYESSGQLKAYLEWAEDKLSRNYFVMGVISGYAPWLDQETCPEGWVYIDDEWLLSAMDFLLQTDSASPSLRRTMHDLRYSVFGDWEEGASPFHFALEKDKTAFRISFADQLRTISRASVSINGKKVRLLELTTSQVVNHVMPELHDMGERHHDVFWFVLRNRAVLSAVLEYAELYVIEGVIHEHWPEVFFYSYEKVSGSQVLNITLDRICERMEGKYFPVYLQFRESKDGWYDVTLIRKQSRSADVGFNEATEEMIKRLAAKLGVGVQGGRRVAFPAQFGGELSQASSWAPKSVRIFQELWGEVAHLVRD